MREITRADLQEFETQFELDPRNRIALNAVAKTPIRSVALNRRAVTRLNHTFSHTVQTGPITEQKNSGRCWMFAGLNLFRSHAAGIMNLESFEFSQSYQMFWDKLEKSNYFLESILSTLDEPTDGRLISHLLKDPIQDGGQWDMFVNLIDKYGVVPKSVMPETESSSATSVMNERITLKLREFAMTMRSAHVRGDDTDTLRAGKTGMMQQIHRILCIHLGEPPKQFMWQWRDKDKAFHRDGTLTPLEFRQKYVPNELENWVCLIHCPQSSKTYFTLYTINYLGNVVGGRIVQYVNVPIEVMKNACVAQIKDGKPVWFGCDVGKHLDRDLGVMDMEIYDYSGVYGVDFGMDKAARLDYASTEMTHAMVFTGVDLDEHDKPTKWRVENSWGEKFGEKGFMVMTDAWFDEYNFEAVVERQYLNAQVLAVLDQEPVGLPPWDPMGALAK